MAGVRFRNQSRAGQTSAAALPSWATFSLFENGRSTKNVVVELDHATLLRLGLGTQEVNEAITEAVAGAAVESTPGGEPRRMIVMRMPKGFEPIRRRSLPCRDASQFMHGVAWECRARPDSP